jgi:hypothetical protein
MGSSVQLPAASLTYFDDYSYNYLSPNMFRKNGTPLDSSLHLSISPKQVLMVISVVESLGTPHRKSHSIN